MKTRTNGARERARRIRQMKRYQLRMDNGLLVPGWRYTGHGWAVRSFGDPLEKHDTAFTLNPIRKSP